MYHTPGGVRTRDLLFTGYKSNPIGPGFESWSGQEFFMSLKLIFFPSVGRVEIEALDAVDDF